MSNTPLNFTALESGTIKFIKMGPPTPVPVLQYKINNGEWTNYTIGNDISLNANDVCYWSGDNETFTMFPNFETRFSSTCKVNASGNIMSLVDSTMQSTTIPNAYCFYGLFFNCVNLLTAPSLPATTLASGCYYRMFTGCTSLTTPPELPATTLVGALYNGCYQYMFYGCTSLTAAPELPATTLAYNCYDSMFYGCTSLTTPPELPATTLANDCYKSMFQDCTSLQVSDTQTEQAPYEWRIPQTGTFTNSGTITISNMFRNCLGTRASDNLVATTGQYKVYYTQPIPVPTYSISTTLTNVTGSSSNPTTILPDEEVTLTFTPNTHYILPNSISVSGASYVWTKATGTLVLSNATDNVSITIIGLDKRNYNLKVNGDYAKGVSKLNNKKIISYYIVETLTTANDEVLTDTNDNILEVSNV